MLLFPIAYFLFRKNDYIFTGSYDVFTFMLDSFAPLLFVVLTVLVYAVSFSNEIKNRFIVQLRTRVAVKKLLTIKLLTNIVLTFSVFFLTVMFYFVFAYYIQPALGIVSYDKSFFELNNVLEHDYVYTQNTFSNLLQYGTITYGLFYSTWVAINAALFSTLSMLLLILLSNSFLALSLPFVIYMIQFFITSTLRIERFQLMQSIFPFNYMQLPMWTALVPFLCLFFTCLAISVYVYFNLKRLDNLQ